MNVVDRFLNYVKFDTQSDELTDLTPSTPGQMIFAQALEKELQSMGLENISLDENGYLMATLPGNIDKKVPTVGFIAHLDTSPDMSGRHVNPRIVKAYEGGDIVLDKDSNVVLSPADFPELCEYKGQDLIVTDGKTLLGADDKAGIAENICRLIRKSSTVTSASRSIPMRKSAWARTSLTWSVSAPTGLTLWTEER